MPDSITPPPELVTSLRNSAPHGIRDAGVTRELWLINHAYAAGADQELEACCKWTAIVGGADALRAARRPKPPSLKEQALEALQLVDEKLDLPLHNHCNAIHTIRRALEALDD